MKSKTTLVKTIFLLLILFSLPAISQQKVGIFESHGDIGKNVKPGTATFVPQTQQYIVSGAGYNIWFDHDEFHYAWKRIKGDFILYTRGELVGMSGVEAHRKLGWMVRKTLEGNSAQISAATHGDGLTSLQFRRTTAAVTEEHKF